jgi:diguanylate cyclase (GGDEF)-like protein
MGCEEDEQTDGEIEQSLSDSDESGSERDQISSDRDQTAADIDQAASETQQPQGEEPAAYALTRRMRADSTLERHTSSQMRGAISVLRDGIAERRDKLAAARDIASTTRDQLAGALDEEIERLERERSPKDHGQANGGAQLRATLERRLAAQSRARAALQRQAAADDRARAARDREHAALDRMAYAQELAAAATDDMTGALRRGVGLVALQREMSRTRRTGEQMIVAFVDVDGAAGTADNDREGHSAGDALLRTVVRLVTDEFRSYDLMLRFGGDEFVCSFSGDGLEEIGERFARVGAKLNEAAPGAGISVGATSRRAQDTIETLLDRADAEMIAKRRCRRRVDVTGLAGNASVSSRS